MVVSAALWQFEPSASTRVTFEDNASLSTTNEDSVVATAITGSLALSSLTATREVRGFLRADAYTYSGDDANLRDHNNFLTGIKFKNKQPLTDWTIDGSFRRDTVLSDVDLIINPGDVTIEPDDDVDNAAVDVTVKRDRLVIRPAFARSLSELTGMRLSYRLNRVNYDPVAGTGLVEFEDNTLTGEYFLNLSERDEFAGSLEFVDYRALNLKREYSGTSLEGVFRRRFDETTKGEVRVGFFRTSFDTTTDSGTEDGFLLGVEGSKKTGVTRYGVRLRRKLFPSGAGDLVRTDEGVLNVFREVSERVSLSFRSRLFENVSLRADNPDANRRYLSLEPRLRWHVSPDWILDFAYRYQRQNRDTDPKSAESNAITVSVSYSKKKPLN